MENGLVNSLWPTKPNRGDAAEAIRKNEAAIGVRSWVGVGVGVGVGSEPLGLERLLMDQVAQPKTLLLRELAPSASSARRSTGPICTDLHRVSTDLHPICTNLHPGCTGLHPICADLAFRVERVDLRRLVRARVGVRVR